MIVRCPEKLNSRDRSGVVMLVTLVLLVVLATLGYVLTSKVSSRRHRAQYMIDYQAARYACDSGVKYALATLENISGKLVSRPNEPDFSDVFYMTDEQYDEYLDEWAAMGAIRSKPGPGKVAGSNDVNMIGDIGMSSGFGDIADDVNSVNDFNAFNYDMPYDYNDPNNWIVRGPYGPQWPYVSEPNEFEIGTAKVQIVIEDENAKYPIGWMLLDETKAGAEIEVGFETFCDWMDVNMVEVDYIKDQLKDMSEIRKFKLEFKEITKRVAIKSSKSSSSKSKSKSKSSSSRRTKRTRTRGRKPSFKNTKVTVTEQVARQAADFSRLLHSPLIDAEALSRVTIDSEDRKESALKYLGMWGSVKVNVNTAPRHVLEAAFMSGSNPEEIAEAIIERRREKPFKDMDDLKNSLRGFSESLEKSQKYITTQSTFFTIKVTATSGVAQASAVIAVVKDAKGVKKVAVISG
ncbi:MAG: type II secretion system protein GspK [Planctomycetota bacterium]